jgi:hypothetical protein
MYTHFSPCVYQLRDAEDRAMLQTALDAMNTELRRILAIGWLSQIFFPEVSKVGGGNFPLL